VKPLRIAATVLGVVLAIAYPFAIYWALVHWSGRAVAALVLALLVPGMAWRFRKADRATFWTMVRLPLAIAALLGLGIATGDGRFVLALPVLINLVLLAEFGATLRSGATPMIERFARMEEPDLDAPKQRHCRQWTAAWCAFFLVNGATAAALAALAPIEWWTLYTGAIAYALMGIMFAGEWVQRRVRFG
jgi:uncharacterized membrane protein